MYVKRKTVRKPIMRKRSKANPYLSRKRSVPVSVKKYVQRTIHRAIEDKRTYLNATGDTVSSVSAAAPYFKSLNWVIAQGTSEGQGSRIGNRLTVKQVNLRGSIVVQEAIQSSQISQLVTLVVFKIKNYQSGINPTYANFFSRMFQLGNTATDLTSTPIDHIRKLNTDIMTVKAVRKFKIGYAAVNTNATSAYIHPNNDFKQQAYFNIPLNKCYKKVQIFDDNVSPPDARNDNLFFMVFTCDASGTGYVANNLTITWDWEAAFEDA